MMLASTEPAILARLSARLTPGTVLLADGSTIGTPAGSTQREFSDPGATLANSGTPPREKLYWKLCNEMRRREIYIRQLRLDPTFRGALTAQQSVAEMDNIFLAGSGYEPKMSAG